MIKVLQVFGEPLSNGGQEAFVMNMYRNIDRKQVQFDFYTPFFCDNEKLKEEINSLGGEVFSSEGKFGSEGSKRDFVKGFTEFLKNHKYKVVHINSGSTFFLAVGAKIAKKSEAEKVIVHSHCTGINNLKYKAIKIISKNIFLKNVDNYLACSKEAAIWRFPKEITKRNKYDIIKNGIDVEKFIYDENIRKEYRKKLDIKENEFVIGNVGRFELQKNHIFLIDVFEEVLKRKQNSKLLLVGTGTLKNEIVRILKEKNIYDKVILLENRSDINSVMQAIDVFVFPSLFEGLGIVAVEAQASGLVTIASENVPEEAGVTELFKKLSLKDKKEKWAEEILKYKQYERKNTIDKIKQKGYAAKEAATKLQKIYTNTLEE